MNLKTAASPRKAQKTRNKSGYYIDLSIQSLGDGLYRPSLNSGEPWYLFGLFRVFRAFCVFRGQSDFLK
jgi:hypothetical protein